jgi:DNA-binding helix-hairpin-helix protein with protein kinase domain
MLKSVSESMRRHSQALGYVPDTGSLLAGGNMEYRLADLIAEGGEGKVFYVENREDIVAKVYKEFEPGRKEKLHLMTQMSTKGLRKVCAWPLSALSDSKEETIGFVMESLIGWQPLHNTYQIRSRLKLFPYQTYAFLVRTARNLATCVHHVHEEGLVIGDLNESNVYVNAKAMVKLIDADSFQVAGPTGLFPCRVGKAELLPPELQGHSLEGLVRTPEHDRFALAALIFQALVFGRHPFAGAVAHNNDITLESCIEHGYYAYTRNREIPVKPPPHLGLEWLPDSIRDLFETAFDPNSAQRPTAKEWYFALRDLETSLVFCSDNPSHKFWGGASQCPWCLLEDRWKIALFRPALTDPEQDYEVGAILAAMAAIPVPIESGKDVVDFDYKTMSPAQLGPWESFFGRVSRNGGWLIFAFFQMANLLGNGRTIFFVVFACAVMLLIAYASLQWRSDWLVKGATKRLGSLAEAWKQEADPSIYTMALQKYYDIANDLKDAKGRFEKGRQSYIEQLHAPELDTYLAKYSILIADAGPIGSEKLSYLHDNGIKSAAHVTDENFKRLPRLMPQTEKEALKTWRRSLEAQFWKSHNYKLTIHQERNLVVNLRKENDLKRQQLEKAPDELQLLAERLAIRQTELADRAEKHVQVLRAYGPKLLALEGKKP